MMKFVKTPVLITIAFFCFNFSNAQLKLPAVMNGVAADVKKVIEDYPNQFTNLMGEVITENTQSTDYLCNFNVNGAEESFVTKYSAKKDVCSWQALMLTTESFDKAKQKFKSLFTQLNNLPVHIGATKNLHLKGKYELPEEDKKFTSIIFSIEPAIGVADKLKVEISLQYFAPMEWKVKMMVYDREREDDERGKTIEE